ncbi:ferritin family protein [Clostridium sp. HV4-5-A1G]|uniref:ferritin family protein n=1 Tax=Clostridium sp. HV4-5-A1G TaxID=2004595 RepID=UPI0012391B11|nr:ferritin family protein [Clostridium sp. HV4-5-A1G]KAA8672695.1 ferritin family protein [Clostridium sp. HV4-5-A1G]
MRKLICRICGAIIDDKNYFYNAEAFEGKNTLDNISFCPFCGAPRKYMISKNENAEEQKYNFDAGSLKIIDHAYKLEIFNGDFYDKVSKLAANIQIKNMFRSLSRVEYVHANIHRKIGGFTVEPKLKSLDYSKYKSDGELLNMACKREKHAVEYYERYADKMNDYQVKKIFDVLAKVEKMHIDLTKKAN